MRTSIIILTYNKLYYTKLCIESIKKYTNNKEIEIIVVDNNSKDGTRIWLADQDNINYIFNDKNEGFPRACNQGILAAKCDNILLLNNDVVVTSNWLPNLTKALFSKKSVGMVGPISNVCSNNQSIGVNYTNLNDMQRFAYNFNRSDPSKWQIKSRLIGFCMLIKKEVIEKVGMLDERFYPGNFEDDDFSLRARLGGYELLLCRDTFIHHFGSITFKDDMDSLLKLRNEGKKKLEQKWGKSYEELFK